MKFFHNLVKNKQHSLISPHALNSLLNFTMTHFFVSALLDANDIFTFLFNSDIFDNEGEDEDNHPLYDKWRAEGGYKNLKVNAIDRNEEECQLFARFTSKHRNVSYDDAKIEVGFFFENRSYLESNNHGDALLLGEIPDLIDWFKEELYIEPYFKITAMIDDIDTVIGDASSD